MTRIDYYLLVCLRTVTRIGAGGIPVDTDSENSYNEREEKEGKYMDDCKE